MLYEQIDPGAAKRISAEVKVDIKVASVTLREADNPGPSRIAKLKIVEKYIDAHHRVGTIHQPGGEFFRGQMMMQWGWGGTFRNGVPDSPDAVWFQGNESKGSLRVGLGGSRRHVLGEPKMWPGGSSTLPIILAGIEDALSWRDLPSWDSDRYNYTGEDMIRHMSMELESDADWIQKNNPAQSLEFLAIPLLETSVKIRKNDIRIVLGTPLYVAHARSRDAKNLNHARGGDSLS